jgi:hypothetical protein
MSAATGSAQASTCTLKNENHSPPGAIRRNSSKKLKMKTTLSCLTADSSTAGATANR